MDIQFVYLLTDEFFITRDVVAYVVSNIVIEYSGLPECYAVLEWHSYKTASH